MQYIEKAYYYKAMLISKNDDIIMSEMYMNLSLDVLLKCGSKKQIYKRYMEMGNIYFKMNNTQEALKYFALALKLTKKI
jgi:tetratricopeptide (TPR) repeat protein